jgi:hypothetical protein
MKKLDAEKQLVEILKQLTPAQKDELARDFEQQEFQPAQASGLCPRPKV